jgi:hypothetical protein
MSAITHTTMSFSRTVGRHAARGCPRLSVHHGPNDAPGASPGRTRQAADSTDRGGHGDVPGSVDDASLHAVGGRLQRGSRASRLDT